MDDLTLALRFGAALGLGVLLGLERERTKVPERSFAGVRTFALVALAGALAAYFQETLALSWLALALFGAMVALVVVSYAVTARLGEVGITTEVSALIAFLLGWLCLLGQVELAASLGVATALTLALKDWLHRLASRIEPGDVEATLKFAIVTLIILPLVPNQYFGPEPLDVINPYQIWLMVVLISGLNFASYLLVKILGQEHGIGLTGLLGGLVSSTAVTFGFAQRSRREPEQSAALGLGILLAWTVMFFRVLVLVAVVSRPLAGQLLLVIGGLATVSLLICLGLWRRRRSAGESANVTAGENPFELGQAVQFGLLFGAVTLAVRAAQVYLGDAGLYLAGAVAGLTDVDAIALSMASLTAADAGAMRPAARTIVIAVGANTLLKAGVAATLGGSHLRRVMLPATLMLLAAGSTLILLI